MSRVMLALALVLVVACASEDASGPEGASGADGAAGTISAQAAEACCFHPLSETIVTGSACDASAVTAEVDGAVTLTLPLCSLTTCEAECAPLYPYVGDYGGCLHACRNPRVDEY